jgi:hypothetical protein
MPKVAFEMLDLQVAQMYTKKFDDNDIEAINKYCESIADFIKACGWTEESYVQRLMRPEGN